MPGWKSFFEEPICSSMDKLDEHMRQQIDVTLRNEAKIRQELINIEPKLEGTLLVHRLAQFLEAQKYK